MGGADGILVGYDGSPGSEQALDWAIWEARAGRAALIVCHVWPPVPGGDPVAAELAGRTGEHLLEEGLQRARAAAAAVELRPLLATGSAAHVLCEHSGDAAMMVVGARGRGGLPGLLLGSVSFQIAAHARVPVTVVRGRWRPAPGHEKGVVVAGADGSPASQAALEFAFTEAALRDVPLLAVCALADSAEALGAAHRTEADFELALARCVRDHPAVTVRRMTVPGGPRGALMEASARAQLLVVGARGRGGLPQMRLGSVSTAVLHHAPCPVTVVRPQ
jgi:nucleotide-binding universal stress UspA family protein